jgi:hypothetical protein
MRVYSFFSVQHKLGLSPFSYCLTAQNNLITAFRRYRWLNHFLINLAPSHNLLYYSQPSYQLFSTRIVFTALNFHASYFSTCHQQPLRLCPTDCPLTPTNMFHFPPPFFYCLKRINVTILSCVENIYNS